jgi:hypothetical protein
MENIERSQRAALLLDWQVRVSKDAEVTDIKVMTLDPTRLRLHPGYLETGELTMVVPAESIEAAVRKAKDIARYIGSSGLWGIEIWDQGGFLASIEQFL